MKGALKEQREEFLITPDSVEGRKVYKAGEAGEAGERQGRRAIGSGC
jgi:hypothetical protein